MNLIDLEMYKWKIFHDVFIPSRAKFHPNKNPGVDWSMYWHEHCAFVSILPRQVGKTEMIIRLVNYFVEGGEDFLIVCPYSTMAKYIDQRLGGGLASKNKIIYGKKKSCINGLSYPDINLLVDEFCFVDYRNLLRHPWKTVTMLSTLL